MVILRNYIVQKMDTTYRAVALAREYCPCCKGKMSVRDSRKRKVILADGREQIFFLRRLQCKNCRRVHLEMPDLMLPYKHYAKQVICCALDSGFLDCPADNSTIVRWKKEMEENYE